MRKRLVRRSAARMMAFVTGAFERMLAVSIGGTMSGAIVNVGGHANQRIIR
jgi:hypothetical protein